MNLDDSLIKFKDNPTDFWTLRDAVRGVQIFGAIGSGKSSGSGQLLALSYLKKGFGGIVLTGKVDEMDVWRQYADRVGRLDDIVEFSPKNIHQFNPLDYELNREGEGAGETANIVSLFILIAKMSNRLNGSSGGDSKDPFWEMALQRLMTASIDLIKLSRRRLTIENICRLIRDAPLQKNYYNDFINLIDSEKEEDSKSLEKWTDESETICALYDAELSKMTFDRAEKRAYEVVKAYFLSEFSTLPDKTRGSIVEYFYAFASPLRAGTLAEYFAQGTSKEVLPERTFEGKIIVLNFPVKKYLQVGIYAQAIYKRMWQQAVERRDIEKYPNPVFMWIDEAQYFINEEDMLFQTTARSARACTVMLSQNISNYYATIGGSHPIQRVDSLLGNLSTKIFHANNDHVTNLWAAETIGKTFQEKDTLNVESEGSSISKQLDYQVQPQSFTMLRTGSSINECQIDGVVTCTGKIWSNGKNYLKTYFNQNI